MFIQKLSADISIPSIKSLTFGGDVSWRKLMYMDGTRVQSWSCNAAGHWIYIVISLGPEMRAGHGCTGITPFVEGGSSEEFVGRGKLKNILFAKK